MKNLKRALSIGMAAVMSVLMLGCGGNQQTLENASADGAAETETVTKAQVKEETSGEDVTITYWHTHSDAEEKVLVETVIPEFEKQNPHIKVDAVRMPYDGLKQQLITAVSSGTAPDVMRMDIIWTPEFAKMGALVPVDDLDGYAELAENLFEAPLSTNVYEGKHYGLPNSTNTIFGYYNKSMLEQLGLEELPTTYDEVLALKDQLNDDQYLIGCDGVNTWSIAPYFYSLGGTYTNEDYTQASGYINSEASVKAIETISQWYDTGVMSPALLGGKPDKANGLFQAKTLFVADGPWVPSSNKEEDVAKIESGMLPSGDAGSISVVGGENVVMFQSGKHNEEAWIFMKFLASEFAQKEMAIGGGVVPPLKSAANSEEVQADPTMKACTAQLENAVARTPSPNWEKMADKIEKAFESIVRHQTTAQETLDKLAEELDALLVE